VVYLLVDGHKEYAGCDFRILVVTPALEATLNLREGGRMELFDGSPAADLMTVSKQPEEVESVLALYFTGLITQCNT
jgi:hypothetical protein